MDTLNKRILVFIGIGLLLGFIYGTTKSPHEHGDNKENELAGKVAVSASGQEVTPKDPRFAKASYYDQSVCEGRESCKTASGEEFHPLELTFAHKSLQFGTWVRFCLNDRCVECRANDRGPYIVGREFDLSYGCADSIGLIPRGVAEVEWEIIK